MTIYVCGNEIEEQDTGAVRLLPTLREALPEIKWVRWDPTEELPLDEEVLRILDVAMGISEVSVLTDLRHLEQVKGSGAHDYDVYVDLKLKQKLGLLKELQLILIPMEMEAHEAVETIVRLFAT